MNSVTDLITLQQEGYKLAYKRHWAIIDLSHIEYQIRHPKSSTLDVKDNLARQAEKIQELLKVQAELSDLTFRSGYKICPACLSINVRTVASGPDGWSTDCNDCGNLLDED